MPNNNGNMPKRSDQRRNRNTRQPDTIRADMAAVQQPPVIEGLVGPAKRWYEALAVSAQAVFYEASDWAIAEVAAMALMEYQQTKRATTLDQFRMMNSLLLTTEGDRRRAYLEIDRSPQTDGPSAGEKSVAEYKAKLGLVKGKSA